MNLTTLDHFPLELKGISHKEIHTVLGGPTLIHLEGEIKEPLFVSCLLHGNEPSGFIAIQKIISKFTSEKLPRSLSIFIGNTLAAKDDQRRLEEQLDFNRVWKEGESDEHKVAAEVLRQMRIKKPFASIDVHNNTGNNPSYSCINVLDDSFFYLSSLFSSTVVYFTEPSEVQSMAFSKICPAVTIEAGMPSSEPGVTNVAEFIEKTLRLPSWPNLKKEDLGISIYHTIARVTIGESSDVCFGDGPGEGIVFPLKYDDWNFTSLKEEHVLGWISNNAKILVTDQFGVDRTNDYFGFENSKIILKKKVVPSMFTRDLSIIKQDCVGYLMEEI